ncbi:MAG TPA: HNH endonuclease, partial [Arthrobacter sp.]
MEEMTAAAPHSAGSLDATRIGDVVKVLASVRPASTGPGMIDQLRELEDLKSLAAAKQARIAVAFDLSQRREQA